MSDTRRPQNPLHSPAPVLIMALAVFMSSLAARAATVTSFSDIVSRLQVSTAANHEFKLVTPTGVQTSTDIITLTFEAGFVLTGLGFDDVDLAQDTDGSPASCDGTFTEKTIASSAGSSPTWGAAFSGQILTLTPPTDAAVGEIAAGSCIRIRIGTNAVVGSTGNNQIVNAGTATAHSIALAGAFGDSGFTYNLNVDGDQLTVTAVVAGGGGGGGTTCPPSCPTPFIFGVNAQNITETTANILWNTDISSTSFVDYGTTIAYGSTTSVGGMTLNHSVPLSGLTPGVLYHYRVRSTGQGAEAVSGDFTFTTPDATAPVLSNIQAVDITGTSARITWDTNEDADSRIDYDIVSGPPYAFNVSNGTLTNAHSLTLTGLTQDTLYRYRVTSKDASNNSVTSVELSFTTLDTLPPVISSISVDQITVNSGRVNWATNELANSTVRYGLTAAYGQSSFVGTLVANHQVTLTGLAAGTLYHYSVSSHDASSNGATSTDQTFTTLPDTTPPANVSGFTATPGDTLVTLNWTNPPNADFAGVKIQRSATGFPANPTAGTTVYDANGTSVINTGLTNGITYFYTAFAYDNSGNFASGALASATPVDGIPPGPVTGLTITPGDQQNQLAWTNPGDADFLQVRIQRSTTSFPATPTTGTTVYQAASPSFLDAGLTNGTVYFYTVFAQDTSLNYSTGAQVSGMPLAPAPVCGNAVCESPETNASCPADCPFIPVCGNAICEPTETTANCATDCPAIVVCGDGTCQSPETNASCPADCPFIPVCGNAICEPTETTANCSADCPVIVFCGDGTCQPPETPVSCSLDCQAPPPEGPVCGNGPCEPGETSQTCSIDCPLVPTEPEPVIEIPEETVGEDDRMDVTKIKYYTHSRTLEVAPNELGFISILSDVIFSVMIKTDAFKKPVSKMYLAFGDSLYQFQLTQDKTAFVVDIVVGRARSGRTSEIEDAEGFVRSLLGIETAHAAETLYTVKTSLVIYYQDGTVEVATPTIRVQEDGTVYETIGGSRVGVEGAKVSLFRQAGGVWSLWNASLYLQSNPATTRSGGTYGFMVPTGEYYFEVEKAGYRKLTTSPITPTSGNPSINIDIELIKVPAPITEVIVPGAPIVENIGNVAKALGAQGAYITKIFQNEVVGDPRVKSAATNYVVPAAAAVTTVVVATAVQATSLIGYLYFLLTQPLLLLGRRKRKEFGIVYNALTKLPVDLAIIRLFRTNGKLVRTSATDKLGRYAFLVEPGDYRIETSKQGYTFPSQYLKDKKEDASYLDLYHGEAINAGERGAVITANIPMDPLDVVKSTRRLYWEEIGRKVQSATAFSGVMLTLITALLYRLNYLWILTAVQLILFLLFHRLARPKRPKNWGIIYDEKTKKPIPFAVARIIETEYNKVLESRVTDSRGRYNFLVGNSKYVVTVEKPGYEQQKTDVIDLSGKKQGEAVVDLDISMKEKSPE